MIRRRVFHVRCGDFARAFCHEPDGLLPWLSMLWRGWRPFHLGGLWSKPSRNLRHELRG